MCVNSSKGGLGLGPESPKGHRSLHWKGEGHRSLHPKGGKVEGRRGRQGLGRMQAPGGATRTTQGVRLKPLSRETSWFCWEMGGVETDCAI